MKNQLLFCMVGMLLMTACQGPKTGEQAQKSLIDKDLFQHHYITQDLPGETDWGYGCPALADFDKDGDLDYAFSGALGLYWFENKGTLDWEMHKVGTMPLKQLGATSFDVDKDGWEDIIIGRYWYRNSQNPRVEPFTRYQYDERVESSIHDIVIADVDGDNTGDLIITGEKEGVFWYTIPHEPNRDVAWERTTITLDVQPHKDHIHAGFFPKGVDDLDGDGDRDLVLPDRWMENGNNGTTWKRHPLPFGKRGPYGLSSRSWIVDLDKDGDNDIVMTDCDQQCSRAAWLENDGNTPPAFTSHFLPMTAPGIRGSFHSLYVGDIDQDGDDDIFSCDQEDDSIFPEGATPRWYIWENISSKGCIQFEEKVIFDGHLGGHDALVGDVDGDGDLDIFSKVWNLWPGNANEGKEHAEYLENKLYTEPTSYSADIQFYIDPDLKSEDPEEKLTYGLFITAPWDNGGALYLNFPEHLEYNPVGNTILRHYDSIPNPWIISPDGKQASYRVQSLALQNVFVESFSRVINEKDLPFNARGVHVAMRIINRGSITLPVIRPLICNQFKWLTGFPQRHHDFQHNYIVIDGQVTSLADLPTENMDTEFKGCVVKGCPQKDTRAERNGGLIEKEMDAALSIVTSTDHKRKVIIWWNPGKSMIANAYIPCIHADPYFGTLKPGEEAAAEGLILFTEGEVEPVVNYLMENQ